MRNKGHELEKDENGFTIMNQKNLSAICERDELFSYPELNEKLYLHYKGNLQFFWVKLVFKGSIRQRTCQLIIICVHYG